MMRIPAPGFQWDSGPDADPAPLAAVSLASPSALVVVPLHKGSNEQNV